MTERLAQVSERMKIQENLPETESGRNGRIKSDRIENVEVVVSKDRDQEMQALREANRTLTERLERIVETLSKLESQLDVPPPSYLANVN